MMDGFVAVLQQKERQAKLLSEASRLLSDLSIAAIETGKKATLTLTMTLEPSGNSINVATKLASKKPYSEEPMCIFYVDENGELTRNDPRQKEFELKEVRQAV